MQRYLSPALEWDDVRVFLALYRARTMAQAAATLGVNTSTVSRRLVHLEEALDTVLFDRGRDGLRSTPAADDLLANAELVEHGVAQFASVAEGLERDVSGQVRVTCPPDVADVVVLPMLRGLLKTHPRLRVTLEPGEATVDLNRREADIALRVVRPTRGDLIVKRIMTVDWMPAASAAVVRRVSPLSDAAAVPWIGWSRFQAAPACRWIDGLNNVEPVLRSDSLTDPHRRGQGGDRCRAAARAEHRPLQAHPPRAARRAARATSGRAVRRHASRHCAKCRGCTRCGRRWSRT